MTQEIRARQQRRRGVILTSQGWEKLQRAKEKSEFEDNSGSRYTLESLNAKTGLAVDTLAKIFGCEAKVDKRSLKSCFRAFNVTLEAQDYFFPESSLECPEILHFRNHLEQLELELPEGQLPIDSPFYIDRPPIEADCYRAIAQPGNLICLQAGKRMGKTSLMAKILHHAANRGYCTVSIKLQLAEKPLLQNWHRFLRWFCAAVSVEMSLPNRLNDYWDNSLEGYINCKRYFERYLLAHTEKPVAIALDDVERLFFYQDIAEPFFALLQDWHEEAKNKTPWRKLRSIVVYSTEVYSSPPWHPSPLNVGQQFILPEFTLAQIKDLAERYRLFWSNYDCERLIQLVSPNPYLIHLALYHIACGKMDLKELLATPINLNHSIYNEHLQRQGWYLQKMSPDLLKALARVVTSERPIELDKGTTAKLQNLGLVQLQNNKVTPSCQLYQQYFRDYFKILSEAI